MKFILGLLFFIPAVTFADPCRITFQQDVNITSTSTRVRVETKERRCLILKNNGGTTVWLKYDSAHSFMEGFSITAGSTYEPVNVPVNAMYMRTKTGDAVSMTILEGK